MKKTIQHIINELGEKNYSIKEIIGFGCVNKVYDVNGDYIIRLNDEPQKQIEYRKEKWCIEKAASIGIPSPRVLKLGLENGTSYMVQNKLEGKNGKDCSKDEKKEIWEKLGNYASRFHQVKKIEDKSVENQEFHKSWKSRLNYNLRKLNSKDSLLRNEVLNIDEHNKVKIELSKLKTKNFKTGLVHGDLSPRNIIWHEELIFLIDWGLAEINIIPHIELGIIMTSGEADIEEVEAFKKGYGISNLEYQQIEADIRIINLLHRLDKYRWAEENAVKNIHDYEAKVRETFCELN